MKAVFDDLFCWSVFSERRQIDFNGHLWVREEGNVLIDPVPMIESDLRQLDDLGGAKWIVVTNRDHQREAAAFRERCGAQVVAHPEDVEGIEAQVDRTVGDGEEIVPGLLAVQLRFGKSAGEIALYWPEKRTLLASDLVVGAPVGRFSLLMDDVLEDPPAAALEVRKLLALDFDAVVVGDGHSVMRDARERLLECLEGRTDIYINQINSGEVEWTPGSRREGYAWDAREIDALVGARNLGYRLIRLPPGQSTFPLHFHHRAEELFYAVEGECTLVTPRGDRPVRKGDFIAFPPGPGGAHKFTNEGEEPCELLALGDCQQGDVAEYPDSDKINFIRRPGSRIFRKGDAVDYWEGE